MTAEFWPWWLGGLAVGAVAVIYPLLGGRLLGVSSMYGALLARPALRAEVSELERALLAETEKEFGSRAIESAEAGFGRGALGRLRLEAERFRPLFLLGMIIGAAIARLAGDDWQLSLSLGSRFDARYGGIGALAAAVLLISGVLIGFGTRLGGGCTSGHGVSGVARGEAGSLLTTAVFWCTAFVVTWLVAGIRRFGQ